MCLLHRVAQSPLGANGIHGAHEGEGFVERHDVTFQESGAQTAHDFLRFVAVAVAVVRDIKDLRRLTVQREGETVGMPPIGDADVAFGAEDDGFGGGA